MTVRTSGLRSKCAVHEVQLSWMEHIRLGPSLSQLGWTTSVSSSRVHVSAPSLDRHCRDNKRTYEVNFAPNTTYWTENAYFMGYQNAYVNILLNTYLCLLMDAQLDILVSFWAARSSLRRGYAQRERTSLVGCPCQQCTNFTVLFDLYCKLTNHFQSAGVAGGSSTTFARPVLLTVGNASHVWIDGIQQVNPPSWVSSISRFHSLCLHKGQNNFIYQSTDVTYTNINISVASRDSNPAKNTGKAQGMDGIVFACHSRTGIDFRRMGYLPILAYPHH